MVYIVDFLNLLKQNISVLTADIYFFVQAVDIKLLGSLDRDDIRKICGDNSPEWISFPVYEQVGITF